MMDDGLGSSVPCRRRSSYKLAGRLAIRVERLNEMKLSFFFFFFFSSLFNAIPYHADLPTTPPK